MTEDEIETEQVNEAEVADEAFTDELSDEALDRGQEGRYCLTIPTIRP